MAETQVLEEQQKRLRDQLGWNGRNLGTLASRRRWAVSHTLQSPDPEGWALREPRDVSLVYSAPVLPKPANCSPNVSFISWAHS